MSYNFPLSDDFYMFADSTVNVHANDLYSYIGTEFPRESTAAIFGSPDQLPYSITQPRFLGANGHLSQLRHSGSDNNSYSIPPRHGSGDNHSYSAPSRHNSLYDCSTASSWDTNMSMYDCELQSATNFELSRNGSGGSMKSRVSNESNSTKNRDTTTTNNNNNNNNRRDPTQRLFCPHPACRCPKTGVPTKSFSRKADVGRHYKSSHEPSYSDCPKPRCDRKGANGFTRTDHLVEHLRGYHGDQVPKRISSGAAAGTAGGGGTTRSRNGSGSGGLVSRASRHAADGGGGSGGVTEYEDDAYYFLNLP